VAGVGVGKNGWAVLSSNTIKHENARQRQVDQPSVVQPRQVPGLDRSTTLSSGCETAAPAVRPQSRPQDWSSSAHARASRPIISQQANALPAAPLLAQASPQHA
jgi:hypothetical protein